MSRLEPHRHQTTTGNKGTSKSHVVGGTVAEAEMFPKVSGGLELETQTSVSYTHLTLPTTGDV